MRTLAGTNLAVDLLHNHELLASLGLEVFRERGGSGNQGVHHRLVKKGGVNAMPAKATQEIDAHILQHQATGENDHQRKNETR